MKKSIMKATIVALIAMVAMPQTADAQGVGGLLKKVKKTVEAVTGTTETNKDNAITSAAGLVSMPIESGGTFQNPIVADIDIVPVGLYGVSTSENYGKAYLVLKVKMNLNKTQAGFGCVKNVKALAVDGDGNVYNIDASGHFNYDVVEGTYVNVKLDEPGLMFLDVKKSAKVMQQIKMGVFIDADHAGVLTLKNVPIQWDVKP